MSERTGRTPRLDRVVRLLSRLPGVGAKTASRYALHLVTNPDLARDISLALHELAERVHPCRLCGYVAESEGAREDARCAVCSDTRRSAKLLCVVAKVSDAAAIERANAHRGRYFVLGRLLSPLEGVGPDELPIARLAERIRADGVEEVILATPTSVDGEATALLLQRELGDLGIRLTRIASGVPHGGDLEYADPITMNRALGGRTRLDSGSQ